MKTFLAALALLLEFAAILLLAVNCGGPEDTQILSLTPKTDYQSGIDNAAELTYYVRDRIQVNGPVGQYKVILTNLSDETLTNVEVVVRAKDPSAVFSFFTRIYGVISWGSGTFPLPTPVQLPDNTILPGPDGFYTVIDADDLPSNSSISFDSILVGEPGLSLYYQAYASLPSGKIASSFGNDQTTVEYNYFN
jgi:hypothetical protein